MGARQERQRLEGLRALPRPPCGRPPRDGAVAQARPGPLRDPARRIRARHLQGLLRPVLLAGEGLRGAARGRHAEEGLAAEPRLHRGAFRPRRPDGARPRAHGGRGPEHGHALPGRDRAPLHRRRLQQPRLHRHARLRGRRHQQRLLDAARGRPRHVRAEHRPGLRLHRAERRRLERRPREPEPLLRELRRPQRGLRAGAARRAAQAFPGPLRWGERPRALPRREPRRAGLRPHRGRRAHLPAPRHHPLRDRAAAHERRGLRGRRPRPVERALQGLPRPRRAHRHAGLPAGRALVVRRLRLLPDLRPRRGLRRPAARRHACRRHGLRGRRRER